MGTAFDLANEVVDVLEDMVKMNCYFSAYNVTELLRKKYPTTDISHKEVRAAVHAYMAGAVGGMGYDTTIHIFPIGAAMAYYPLGQEPTEEEMDELDEAVKAVPKSTPKPQSSAKAPRNMKMLPVTSSAFSHIGYDADSRTLRVEFHGGRVYDYPAVEPEVFARLITADSVGKWYNAHVKLMDSVQVS